MVLSLHIPPGSSSLFQNKFQGKFGRPEPSFLSCDPALALGWAGSVACSGLRELCMAVSSIAFALAQLCERASLPVVHKGPLVVKSGGQRPHLPKGRF